MLLPLSPLLWYVGNTHLFVPQYKYRTSDLEFHVDNVLVAQFFLFLNVPCHIIQYGKSMLNFLKDKLRTYFRACNMMYRHYIIGITCEGVILPIHTHFVFPQSYRKTVP